MSNPEGAGREGAMTSPGEVALDPTRGAVVSAVFGEVQVCIGQDDREVVAVLTPGDAVDLAILCRLNCAAIAEGAVQAMEGGELYRVASVALRGRLWGRSIARRELRGVEVGVSRRVARTEVYISGITPDGEPVRASTNVDAEDEFCQALRAMASAAADYRDPEADAVRERAALYGWWPCLLLIDNNPVRQWWQLPDGRIAGISPIYGEKQGGGRPTIGWQPAVSSPTRGKGRRFGPRFLMRPDTRDASERIGDAGAWLAAHAQKAGWTRYLTPTGGGGTVRAGDRADTE